MKHNPGFGILQLMTNDRREKLLEKKRSLEAQIKAIDARERQRQRKLDTRRKIIAGALALEHAEGDEEFGARLYRLINRYVTKPAERELFGLPPKESKEHEGQGAANENPDGKQKRA